MATTYHFHPNLDARIRAAKPQLTDLERFRLADQLLSKEAAYVEGYLGEHSRQSAARDDRGTAPDAGRTAAPKAAPRVDSAAARQKMIKELEQAWQKPAA